MGRGSCLAWAAGASWSTTWTLVPEKPKEETAASRGCAGTGQRVGSVGTKKRVFFASMAGCHRVKCRLGGTSPCCRHRTALMSPVTPAAGSRWPRFVLTEPSAQRAWPVPYTSARLANSVGSPTGVPVPWASIIPTSCGRTPLRASASSYRARWAAAEGAASPSERPSWFTAEPRITARIRSRSRTASASRLSTMTPQPSPRTNPSAAASKVRQRPVGESMPILSKDMVTLGRNISVTPPASARSHSPACSAWQARCRATSEDEHAVSSDTLGPWSPSR